MEINTKELERFGVFLHAEDKRRKENKLVL